MTASNPANGIDWGVTVCPGMSRFCIVDGDWLAMAGRRPPDHQQRVTLNEHDALRAENTLALKGEILRP